MELIKLIEERKLKKRARGVYYNCLLILAFISLPWLFINLFGLSRYPGFFEVAATAGVPLLPCIIVTGWKIWDKELFYSSHAKQALFLLGLQFLSLFFVVWTLQYGDESFSAFLFFIVNGGLWLFGNTWGLGQVRKGQCWWAAKFGHHPPFELTELNDYELGRKISDLTNRRHQQNAPQPQAYERPVQPQPRQILQPPPAAWATPERPAVEERTVEELLETFRVGDAAARAEAVRKLEALGAIGEF